MSFAASTSFNGYMTDAGSVRHLGNYEPRSAATAADAEEQIGRAEEFPRFRTLRK